MPVQGGPVQGGPVQGGAARQAFWSRRFALPLCFALATCSNVVSAPVDLFHDLEGGEIAAKRPPPPNANAPYPKLGTVPAKPVVADPAYRLALLAQLAAERDRTERVAADRPIEAVPPPPGPATPPATSASAQPAATATLDTAEAPAPPAPVRTPAPRAAHPGRATAPVAAMQVLPVAEPATITDPPNLPTMPTLPPAPASFEGVLAEPAPTVRVLPVHVAAAFGTEVFFPTASAALPPSQTETLKTFVGRRHGRSIEIIGMGEAVSDTPDGQATAVALALGRARAVAEALAGLHVPQDALQIGADAFGRGAVLRLLP